MKKYQMGGSGQPKSSDKLNPYKMKTNIAPNPPFISSGNMSQMKKGGQMKKSKKC